MQQFCTQSNMLLSSLFIQIDITIHYKITLGVAKLNYLQWSGTVSVPFEQILAKASEKAKTGALYSTSN